jgi:hypothetical protein
VSTKKSSRAIRTGTAIAFISLVAADAGTNSRDNFITQVSHRLFETDGITMLKHRTGQDGNWRMRSVRYEHEDIKAFPPNTNLLFGVHSLNGTSTIWPEGYQRLFDAFGDARLSHNLWDPQMSLNPSEAAAADFACVRYAVGSNKGLPVVFPPVLRLVAAKAGIPSRVRIMQVGDEARLAVWQEAGETLNFAMDLPFAEALDFAVGFDAAARAPGDTVSVWLTWEKGGRQAGFRYDFDILRDRARWYPFRMRVAPVSDGRVRMKLGCTYTGRRRRSPVTVAWSGLDLVVADCAQRETGGGYAISVKEGSDYALLRLRSETSEVPLEVLLGESQRRIRWVAFPPHMPRRQIFVDLTRRMGDEVMLRSDSAFTLEGCSMVYLDVGVPDYHLIYDKDMYIYENLAAIKRGVCLAKDAIGIPDEGSRNMLAVAHLGGIADVECGTSSIVSYQPERVILDVRADKDCFLLFQDTYYPGWKAYVDGGETRILDTDIGMRAIELEAGNHAVEMKYAPTSLLIGLILTCAGLVLSFVYARRPGASR